MTTIAGHEFADTVGGRRCVLFSASRNAICNVSWLHVRSATQDDVDKTTGIAHAGTPTQKEYEEIMALRDEETEAVWAAVIDAASAGSR